jgi:hypothetical protein
MPTIARTMPSPPGYEEPDAMRNESTTPASMLVSDPIASATRTLREQGMPPEEIEAVLVVEEPQVLRRYMELHRERLDERLAVEQRALAGAERFLALAMLERTDRETARRGGHGSPPDGRGNA